MITLKCLPAISYTKFPQQIVQFLASKPANAIAKANEFTPVYTFPHITSLAVINKAKLYQTLLTCIVPPCSYSLFVDDLCSHEVFAGITALGISGCVLFHTLGLMASNTVGVLYLHKNNQTTKITYLDTWGSIRDTVIELKDIIPFCDQPMALTDPLYLKLQKYTSREKLKLNVKYGEVLDCHKFAKIFNNN